MQGVIKELKSMTGWQFLAATVLIPIIAEGMSDILLAAFHGHPSDTVVAKQPEAASAQQKPPEPVVAKKGSKKAA